MTRAPRDLHRAFVDQDCAQYHSLFTNVRHFEQFTVLHGPNVAKLSPGAK